MREIRQSGSEGGGIGSTDSPYPYRTGLKSLLKIYIDRLNGFTPPLSPPRIPCVRTA